MTMHAIPPGLWCVPSALVAITGDDFETVIHPGLNRHMGREHLLELVTGATMNAAVALLLERGYKVSKYKRGMHRLKTWGELSRTKYPGRVFLAHVPQHAVAICDGRVYDSWTPHGAQAEEHPYKNDIASDVWLVQKKG